MPTIDECKKYYADLNAKCLSNINSAFSSSGAEEYCKNHNFIADLEKWLQLLSVRPEISVIKASMMEYQFSLLALVQGQYRQAFMALRLSFELALASISFSANELELRIWLQGAPRYSEWVMVWRGVYPTSEVFLHYES